ncbi:homoserine O-acetyltransferase MetX [Streptomyces coerulescens]|uniref:Homoserine O-acetyltransferase n=1 Tax=Streptomyces coerulescens TaxID=29304 RepID=A0ABW0CHN6_STRCD
MEQALDRSRTETVHGAGTRPVTGAWLPGQPAGRRSWFELPEPLKLESGETLPDVALAFETWGTLAPDGSNAVLVLHALTGDSHAAGPAGSGHPTPGWWDACIGRGRPLDPAHWFIVVPNALGGCQGSTGPSSTAPDGRAWGSRFPAVTLRDLASAEAALADALGISRWAAVIGGSLGGMRALEWAADHPERVARLGLLACSAVASADQIAFSAAQVHAITADPHWHGGDYYDAPAGRGPHRGLGIARRIAHLTYRSAPELNGRFGTRPQGDEDPLDGGRYAVESYLDHQADKLLSRFDAGSYVTLTRAMSNHDVGRHRGGVRAALHRIQAPTAVAGITSDRLFPLWQQRELAEGLPDCRQFRVIGSAQGHDAFLTETEQVAAFLTDLLG